MFSRCKLIYSSRQSFTVNTVITPTSWMRKLCVREAKEISPQRDRSGLSSILLWIRNQAEIPSWVCSTLAAQLGRYTDHMEQGQGCGASRKGQWKCQSLSRVWLFMTPRTVARQVPLSMGFSRQEDWSGYPFPSPGDILTQGSNSGLLHCRCIVYCLRH